MNTFTINGVVIKAQPIDFGMVCNFEDLGLSFSDIGKKSNSFMRAYLSICAGVSIEEAGQMMQEHILADGTFEGIATAFSEELEKSDFFRKIIEMATEETPKKKSQK